MEAEYILCLASIYWEPAARPFSSMSHEEPFVFGGESMQGPQLFDHDFHVFVGLIA